MTTVLENAYQQVFANNSAVPCAISDDCTWHVAHPINSLVGKENILNGYFNVLRTAMPDIERRPFISFSDNDRGETWQGSTGYLVGTFSHDLLDIPATGKTLYLRYMELSQVCNEQVVSCYTIIDFIDAMEQAGVNPIRKCLGRSGLVLPPATFDGLCQDEKNNDLTQSSINLVKAMHAELGRFDGTSLSSMDLAKHWHPDFLWYGPGGIGTTRGISGFREHHQGPFLRGFPDRGIDGTLCFIGHNNYVATGGWPHMYGTLSGDDWLGLKATNIKVLPRVMDFWRNEGGLLRENWVAIDIIDMLWQMDIDVFAVMKENLVLCDKQVIR
ncbi:polyketide cyclase [Thalassotalea sp. HSM 43]|uniref:ester cyclase n=1 Tax=Thalassotalea sp. HSM 43 TaxID=2552945 RepID=UPI00108228DD|nr:ester cyclase [Thalassotalea sp. HSM 43]QBY04204.1 polyketide cyclase [Thalassotalea sp. HSM 43]